MNTNTARETRRAPEPEKTRRSGSGKVGAWREHHLWSMSISLRRLGARPLGTLLTVAVMGVALALPLTFYLLLDNVQRMGDALGRNQSISAFMKPGLNAGMADTAASALRGLRRSATSSSARRRTASTNSLKCRASPVRCSHSTPIRCPTCFRCSRRPVCRPKTSVISSNR